MSETGRDRPLSLEEELQVDELCERFERELAAGSSPDLTSFVDAAPEPLRGRLDRELRLLLTEIGHADEDLASSATELPERFGPYRIVGSIGSGGMGSVYEAIQDHPRRRVALKVIRHDLISAHLRQRFGREIRLLAHLQHPGIARALEAGSAPLTPGGKEVPYLAMEYIDGRPLLDYAREEELSVRQRVQLVRQLGLALQHAHDQGVLHRDLKPANVLVTRGHSSVERQGSSRTVQVGHPVILDFGLARAMGEDGRGSLETMAGQLLGTLSHMAPEQLDGGPQELDARCDVYALGVILYELLAGRPPVDLEGLSVPAAIIRLRETEAKPLGELRRELRGDLETIAAKALEEDRERRYDSALEFCEDLQRYLDDVPILARPAGAWVQLGKFARRNPALVAGLGTSAVLLALALVVVSIFAVRQRELRAEAQESERNASLEAAKAQAIAEFQRKMFRRANLAEGGRTHNVTLLDVLSSGAQELDGAFPEQPLVEASLRQTIGRSLSSLGSYDQADAHLRRAIELRTRHLGSEHPDTIAVRAHLGVNLEAAGRYEEALTEHDAVLTVLRRGPQDEPLLAATIGNLAAVLERLSQYERSIALHRESLALWEQQHGPGSIEVATALNNLATAIEYGGDLREAVPLYERCLSIRRKQLKAPHAHLANALNNLGGVHLRLQDLELSRPLLEEALAMREQLLGPDHSLVGSSLGQLSSLAYREGDFVQAEELIWRAIEVMRNDLGEDHPNLITIHHNLASLLEAQGLHEDALVVYDETIERATRVLGPKARVTLNLRSRRLETLGSLGRTGEVEAAIPRLLAACREALGRDSLTADQLLSSARMAWRRKDEATARAHFQEAAEIMEAAVGPTHAWALLTRADEVEFLRETGDIELALERGQRALEHSRAALGDQHPTTTKLENEVHLLESSRRP